MHKLFRLANLDWVPPRSICDMVIIHIRDWEAPLETRFFGKTTCLALIWIVRWEKNVGIFKNKVRTLESLSDISHFYTSFWASYITAFKDIPLNIVHLDWFSMCRS